MDRYCSNPEGYLCSHHIHRLSDLKLRLVLLAGNCPALTRLIKEQKVQAWNLPLGMGATSCRGHPYMLSLLPNCIDADGETLMACSVPHDKGGRSWAARTHISHRGRNIRVSHAARASPGFLRAGHLVMQRSQGPWTCENYTLRDRIFATLLSKPIIQPGPKAETVRQASFRTI